MPVALLIIGVIFAVAALRGTHVQLGQQLQADLFGGTGPAGSTTVQSGNFIYWVAAIIIIGMLGYIPGFQTPARLLLAVVVVSLILSKPGLFTQFNQQLQNTQVLTTTTEPLPTGPPTVNVQGLGAGGSSGGSSTLGQVGDIVSGASGILGGIGKFLGL